MQVGAGQDGEGVGCTGGADGSGAPSGPRNGNRFFGPDIIYLVLFAGAD